MTQNGHVGSITQLCRAVSSQLRHVLTIGNKPIKQQYLLHTSSNYGELRPTSSWDRSVSLGHPSKFQQLSLLGIVATRHSNSGRQPNFAALDRGRHLYSAGWPSRWASAHILVMVALCNRADHYFVFLFCYSVLLLLVNACFCCVRLNLFNTMTRGWLGRTSLQWPIFLLNGTFNVGKLNNGDTSTHSVSLLSWFWLRHFFPWCIEDWIWTFYGRPV